MIGHFATPAQLLQHALNCCQDDKVIMQNQIDVFEEQVSKLEAFVLRAERTAIDVIAENLELKAAIHKYELLSPRQ